MSPLLTGLKEMQTKARRAFTLLELLVVMAVVGVLAAFLLPVLNRAKAKARRLECLGNLRQINVGVRMYADDSADKAPGPEGTWTNRVLSFAGYKKLVRSYVGSAGVSSPKAKLFACPADGFFYTVSNDLMVVKMQPMHEQTFVDFSSYGFNGGNLATDLRRFGVDVSQCGIAGLAISSIRHPAKTVLVAEAPAFEPWSWHQPRRPLSEENSHFNDAMNMVSFVDGHVSYIKIFWTNTAVAGRVRLGAAWITPPPSYEYQWGGD